MRICVNVAKGLWSDFIILVFIFYLASRKDKNHAEYTARNEHEYDIKNILNAHIYILV